MDQGAFRKAYTRGKSLCAVRGFGKSLVYKAEGRETGVGASYTRREGSIWILGEAQTRGRRGFAIAGFCQP